MQTTQTKTNRQVYSIPDIICTRSTWKHPKVAHSDIFLGTRQTPVSVHWISSHRRWLPLNFYSWLSPPLPVFCYMVMSPKSFYNRKWEKIHLFLGSTLKELQRTWAMQAVTVWVKHCPVLSIPKIKKQGCLHLHPVFRPHSATLVPLGVLILSLVHCLARSRSLRLGGCSPV